MRVKHNHNWESSVHYCPNCARKMLFCSKPNCNKYKCVGAVSCFYKNKIFSICNRIER